MKLAWARGGSKSPDTPQLQTGPDAPRTVLPVLDAPTAVVVSARPAGMVLQSSAVTTKLRLLARCHLLARWAWWKRLGVALLGLPVCIALSVAVGMAVYMSIYDEPRRHAREYHNGWDQRGQPIIEYYLDRGHESEKVSKQEYDFFLANQNRDIQAGLAAGVSGVAMLGLTFGGWLWFLGRRRTPIKVGLEEQIQAILEAHPDEVKSWGGPSVLHHPGLVDELLRIEDKGGR